MTDDITIPPAALEAAYNARRNGDTLEDICLAMLRAWPGMDIANDDDWCAIRKGWITLPQEMGA